MYRYALWHLYAGIKLFNFFRLNIGEQRIE